jgi:RimJ/RimL family protein N-acetyltransferase
MSASKFLETDRIYLSPIETEDIGFFIESMNDEDVRVLARSRRDVMNEVNAKEMVEDLQKNEEGFIIRRKEGDERIGYGLIVDHDKYNRQASLALVIGKKENRGMGFGGEAIKLLMRHAFIDLNLESLYLSVYEYNKPAMRLYEKVGFKVVGKRRNAVIVGNRRCGEVIMDMLADEYFELYGDGALRRWISP